MTYINSGDLMQKNNLNKTIPEPLMFIHTVSTPITKSSSKNYFDSRDNVSKTIRSVNKETINTLLLNKIKNIVQMYKQGTNILCLIETKNNESIEGLPINIEQDTLTINSNDDIIKVKLKNIHDVIILKI